MVTTVWLIGAFLKAAFCELFGYWCVSWHTAAPLFG